jgi:hypothetical protein
MAGNVAPQRLPSSRKDSCVPSRMSRATPIPKLNLKYPTLPDTRRAHQISGYQRP